jgi:hypothetical protein
VGQAVDQAILDLHTHSNERCGQMLPFMQGSRINDDDSELLSLFMRSDKCLLDYATFCKSQDDIAILNLFGCALGNNLIRKRDSLSNKHVDRIAKAFLGFGIWDINVYL